MGGIDDLAFTALYTAHAPGLERYVAGITRDRPGASDIVHDTLLKAIEHPVPATSWLYRVAHNAALDHLRRSSRSVAEAPGDIDRRRDRPDPTRLIEWGSAEEVHAALDVLSPAQRNVTLLRYRAGLTTAETGTALGKSPAAIRQLESRALGTLREQLT